MTSRLFERAKWNDEVRNNIQADKDRCRVSRENALKSQEEDIKAFEQWKLNQQTESTSSTNHKEEGMKGLERITDPGKFEAEEVWVLKAYDEYMEGCWDEFYNLCDCEDDCDCDKEVSGAFCEVDTETTKQWEIPEDTKLVVLFFSEYGFVTGSRSEDADKAIANLEAQGYEMS